MSFLAPLYIAGLLAVSLPIVFHLIRRTPRGRVTFSSLMFLGPSPPRVTSRSRLNNFVLLLLRAAALLLLAFAFARPFLRDADSLNLDQNPGRRIVLLVDTSASLRRGDLWSQARQRLDDVLNSVTPADRVSLLAFADAIEIKVSFDAWSDADPARRVALVRSALDDLGPTWGATHLADALAAAADLLVDASDRQTDAAEVARQIVLVSDLQRGAQLDALARYAWPKGVQLDVHGLTVAAGTNAAVHLAGTDDDQNPTIADGKLRVRLSNEPDATREQFTLHWATAAGDVAGVEPIPAYVPPGASRTIRVPLAPPAAAADRLVLRGDDADFDNTLFLVPPRQEEVVVGYFGADAADDPQAMRYYLERVAGETPRRKWRLVAIAPSGTLDPRDAEPMRLAVVAGALSPDHQDHVRRFVERGGTALVVAEVAEQPVVSRLLELPELSLAEAKVADHALLGEIAYGHPLFAAFADPRFGDFTKIHFWHYRRAAWPAGANVAVVARFDNGDPAIVEHALGSGHVVALFSSWRPADSQLATSSKFVPLLGALLERAHGPESEPTQYVVGDVAGGSAAGGRNLDRPGVFDLAGRRVAVNLRADESRTAPLAIEELEQRGAQIGSEAARSAERERSRQLRNAELENRQKLWRWLIVAVLGFVMAETTVAGYLTRKQDG